MRCDHYFLVEGVMEEKMAGENGRTAGDDLPRPNHKIGADWFTKLATAEKAKAVRRETQKARKGKRLTFSDTRGRARVG